MPLPADIQPSTVVQFNAVDSSAGWRPVYCLAVPPLMSKQAGGRRQPHCAYPVNDPCRVRRSLDAAPGPELSVEITEYSKRMTAGT